MSTNQVFVDASLEIPPLDEAIAAAGKVLAKRNADRIKTSIKSLVSVLADANILSQDDLQAMLDDEKDESEALDEESSMVEAGSFKEDIAYLTWGDRLRTTLRAFESRFEMLHSHSESEVLRFEDKPREEVIQSMIEDLSEILTSLHTEYPKTPQYDRHPSRIMASEETFIEEVEDGDEGGLQSVQASSHIVAFDCPVDTLEIEASSGEYNRRPLKGILFRIDEPSEAIPSVGPGLPLYIPGEVAAKVVSCAAGLPLDADDSLSKHANEQIVGVIQSAAINNKDFEVQACLWPWSQKKKVQAIAQNRDRLGMSMNAAAKGHVTKVNNVDVFWVDELQLLGANILYSDRATFRKTRLISANSRLELVEEPDLEVVQIAAESEDLTQEEMEMSKEILAQLSALSASLNTTVESLNSNFERLDDKFGSVHEIVKVLKEDYDKRKAEIQASAQQKSQEEQQLALAALIEATVRQVVNPSGSPARRTHSAISASGQPATNSVDLQKQELMIQLASVNGQITAIEKMPGTVYSGASMIELKDQARLLAYQLENL